MMNGMQKINIGGMWCKVKMNPISEKKRTKVTTPPPNGIKLLELPGRKPGQSIILYKLAGEGKDPLD